jgi:hypothetical protein
MIPIVGDEQMRNRNPLYYRSMQSRKTERKTTETQVLRGSPGMGYVHGGNRAKLRSLLQWSKTAGNTPFTIQYNDFSSLPYNEKIASF